MKATEFRLGNLIEYPGWNKDGSKAFFSIRDIYFEDGKIGLTNGIIQIPNTNVKHLKPIPITKKLLLTIGFKYLDSSDRFYICSERNHLIYIYFEKVKNCFAMVYNGSQFCTIEHVHQLQNLYFALTNEELIISK